MEKSMDFRVLFFAIFPTRFSSAADCRCERVRVCLYSLVHPCMHTEHGHLASKAALHNTRNTYMLVSFVGLMKAHNEYLHKNTTYT